MKLSGSKAFLVHSDWGFEIGHLPLELYRELYRELDIVSSVPKCPSSRSTCVQFTAKLAVKFTARLAVRLADRMSTLQAG